MNLSTQRFFSFFVLLSSFAALGWVAWGIQQSHFQVQPIAPTPNIVSALTPSLAKFNVNTIINAHIFGQAHKVSKPRAVKAPPTRLKLKLVGIFVSATNHNDQALALIETADRKQHVIALGQLIGNSGATLSAVEEDHILIEHSGKLEKLGMQRPVLEERIQAEE